MIKFLKRLFFPSSYYSERLDALRNEFLEATEKDKLLASFAKYLIPIHEVFTNNCINNPSVEVDKKNFPEIYKLGIVYYMGMKIKWT